MTAPSLAKQLARRISWDDINPDTVRHLIDLARAEDLHGLGLSPPPAHGGDLASSLLRKSPKQAAAALTARQPLVACGLPLVPMILEAYGGESAFEPACQDGDSCPAGSALGKMTGPAHVLLESERVILNFLQHLCGIATLTESFVHALGESGTRLLDTRKTTPGFRVLEKYAVACGGGFNHRMGLFDRIMLKDNHLAAAGAREGPALASFIGRARTQWPDRVIQLEVDSLAQIPPALEAGIEVLLLDNFSLADLREALALVGNRAATEASGGITLDGLPLLAGIGLDFISTGATVHQATWRDIGLDWL
ncbi:MAG: carboxylating nicotinate-nucleotide diphosphorylase [Oceanipulchritudo sp.]